MWPCECYLLVDSPKMSPGIACENIILLVLGVCRRFIGDYVCHLRAKHAFNPALYIIKKLCQRERSCFITKFLRWGFVLPAFNRIHLANFWLCEARKQFDISKRLRIFEELFEYLEFPICCSKRDPRSICFWPNKPLIIIAADRTPKNIFPSRVFFHFFVTKLSSGEGGCRPSGDSEH